MVSLPHGRQEEVFDLTERLPCTLGVAILCDAKRKESLRFCRLGRILENV